MMISKQDARELTEELLTAIDGVLAKHGLSRDRASSNYGDKYAIKVEAHPKLIDANSGVDRGSPYATAFDRYHDFYGLKPAALGATVPVRVSGVARDMQFIGIAAKRRKFPYAFRDPVGKVQLFTDDVLRHFPPELRSAGS